MPKVLVVDRDVTFRRTVRDRLSSVYDVSEADNPDDAVDLALRIRPDCVLMELMMPTLIGLDLCEKLGALSLTRPIPIFLTDTAPPAGYHAFCLGRAPKEYFEKPVDFERLKSRLDVAVGLKKPERRREMRVLLQVDLKLRGLDSGGDHFEIRTTTDNVSANGFHCSLPAPLHRNRIVQVFCITGGERFVGSARVARTSEKGKDATMEHGFEFVEKAVEWILG
jgi:CheY-like chemotaxis protein